MQKNLNTSGAVPQLALGRKQAASSLNISTVTLDRLVERGLLRPSRATRRPLFSVSELQRFLAETQGKVPA